MTLLLIFLGWFILNSLWGFLPLIEPLRQFALGSSQRRKTLTFGSALLALMGGVIMLLWLVSYSGVVLMVYDAHAVSGSAVAVDISRVASELVLRQLLPGSGCFSADAAVCGLAAQTIEKGGAAGMLPILGAAALVPALAAAYICWKLTAISPEANPS